jgi:hypothetical protein
MKALTHLVGVCAIGLGSSPAFGVWTWETVHYPGAAWTTLTDVDDDKVVGYCQIGNRYQGFIYENGAFTDLSWPDHPNLYPTGISGNVIVGTYQLGGNHGFAFDGNKWTALEYPGSAVTSVAGIDGSSIVGNYNANDGFGNRGFLYDGITWKTLDRPLTWQTYPRGISGDRIVGASKQSTLHLFTGFVYDGRTWTTLTYPGADGQTFANGICGNNIVGVYADDGVEHGFLYDGATWTTLDYPDVTGNTNAMGISGDKIVGRYGTRGFILTIPEPAMALFGALAGMMLLKRKRWATN